MAKAAVRPRLKGLRDLFWDMTVLERTLVKGGGSKR